MEEEVFYFEGISENDALFLNAGDDNNFKERHFEKTQKCGKSGNTHNID